MGGKSGRYCELATRTHTHTNTHTHTHTDTHSHHLCQNNSLFFSVILVFPLGEVVSGKKTEEMR